MDEAELAARLREAFPGSDAEVRVVVRQASDLAASDKPLTDRGHALTAAEVVDELADAPDGSVADRWNWWIGALEVAYGGYRPFRVDRWEEGRSDG